MNILLIDDHRLFRSALLRLLKFSFDYDINCEEAENGLVAIEKLRTKKFDVLFLDVSMPQMNGIEACKHIMKEHKGLPIIILSQLDDENLIFHFINLGVHSFLTKGTSIDELKAAVDSVLSGKKYFSPEIESIIRNHKNASLQSRSTKIDLTCREQLLLQLLQQGLTSKEIAKRMELTENTIRTYKERIMEKTNTKNVAELVTFGFRNGILR